MRCPSGATGLSAFVLIESPDAARGRAPKPHWSPRYIDRMHRLMRRSDHQRLWHHRFEHNSVIFAPTISESLEGCRQAAACWLLRTTHICYISTCFGSQSCMGISPHPACTYIRAQRVFVVHAHRINIDTRGRRCWLSPLCARCYLASLLWQACSSFN